VELLQSRALEKERLRWCTRLDLLKEEGEGDYLTGGSEFVGKAAAVLFMARWGKVKIRPGHGFCGDEVGQGRNEELARFHLMVCLGGESGEEGGHRRARVGNNGGREMKPIGGGYGVAGLV
jgi:hypothetical protein